MGPNYCYFTPNSGMATEVIVFHYILALPVYLLNGEKNIPCSL